MLFIINIHILSYCFIRCGDSGDRVKTGRGNITYIQMYMYMHGFLDLKKISII